MQGLYISNTLLHVLLAGLVLRHHDVTIQTTWRARSRHATRMQTARRAALSLHVYVPSSMHAPLSSPLHVFLLTPVGCHVPFSMLCPVSLGVPLTGVQPVKEAPTGPPKSEKELKREAYVPALVVHVPVFAVVATVHNCCCVLSRVVTSSALSRGGVRRRSHVALERTRMVCACRVTHRSVLHVRPCDVCYVCRRHDAMVPRHDLTPRH